MVVGIIYKYTSPSGKSYIGQTVQEEIRRKLWNSNKYHYAGTKIDRARAKYGKNAFDYSILFEKNFSTNEIAIIWLNIAEQYYIKLYDTVENGYNCEHGGGGNATHTGAINHHHGGYKLSEEARKHIGEGAKAWQNSPEGKAKMSAARKGKTKNKGYRIERKFKPVVQLTKNGEFIQEHASIRDASEYLASGSISIRANISAVCTGKRESAGNYTWLFSDDYYTYFLHPERQDIPQRVQRALDAIKKRNAPKIKKKYPRKPKPKKEGPRINRFAKQIGQYDLNFKLVKVWRCASEAATVLGICQSNVSRAIRTLGTYMGYYWRNYNGEQMIQPKPKKVIKRPKAQKKVMQMDLTGGVLHIYDSIRDACKAVGANHPALMSKCLNGKTKTAYGFKWKFLNCA